MDYPIIVFTGSTDDGETVEVSLHIDDEYRLVDEAALIETVWQYLASVSTVTSVGAEKRDIRITPIPEA